MIEIDGSIGEGGGQIVRSALGLSLVTGRPFTISKIRAGRKKPGLMRQHLTAVSAAATIGSAETHGDEIGSDTLTFVPGKVQGGEYRFAIGTAGSCTLVLQAVLPALLMAKEPSKLVIEGGTHNQYAPPFDFLQRTFLPIVEKMGAKVSVKLVRTGFFPAGGGCLEASITPAPQLVPIEINELSKPTITARALSAKLPEHIGLRELQTIADKLGLQQEQLENQLVDSFGPGNIVSIFVASALLTETFTGFGEKNVSAEKVGKKAAGQVRKYLQAGAPVGPYLTDQLLIPLALAGAGAFRTCRPTAHTRTNIEVIQKFLDVSILISQQDTLCWEINVE